MATQFSFSIFFAYCRYVNVTWLPAPSEDITKKNKKNKRDILLLTICGRSRGLILIAPVVDFDKHVLIGLSIRQIFQI